MDLTKKLKSKSTQTKKFSKAKKNNQKNKNKI